MTNPDAGTHRITFAELEALLTTIFMRAGASEANARILGRNCAMCERDGSLSHGIFRIAGYLGSLKSGWADGRAIPRVEEAGPAFLRVDANNGFAQPALEAARSRIHEIVARTGVAIMAIRNSHHFSALWPDLEPFATAGFVSLTTVSGLACVVPPGGRSPVFGTNPIAFATPVSGAAPLIFDLATSAMSNGDLRIAAGKGDAVPPGTGIDRSGVPTTNAKAILDGGGLLPFGGHKGASIALMVEILSSALTGGAFSSEVDFSGHPGAETPRTGQFLLVIDPVRGCNSAFEARVRTLLDTLRHAGLSRLPSDRRYANRARAEKAGIAISRQRFADLLALA